MKEYDIVELIRDRPEYEKYGVKKGMFGVIMNDEKVSGRWYVIFSEFYTGEDIADLSVREEDLLVYDDIPADRMPAPPRRRRIKQTNINGTNGRKVTCGRSFTSFDPVADPLSPFCIFL